MWIKCFYYVFDYVYGFWIVMLMYDGVGEFYILLFVGKIVYVLVVIVKKMLFVLWCYRINIC